MIEGYLDEAKRPRIDISVDGRSSSLSLEAIIDTKFDGDICLPVEIAVQMGLEPAEVVEVRKPDGEIVNKILFAGKMEWFKEGIDIDIFIHDTKDVLLGTRLLQECKLEINYHENKVRIEKLM